MFPSLDYEIDLWKKGYAVVGVDEVGRGALAGPVYVGAYCLAPTANTEVIKRYSGLHVKDCKQLSPAQREKLCLPLREISLTWATEKSDVDYINEYGIVPAVQNAVRKVLYNIHNQLKHRYKLFVILDAFRIPHLPGVQERDQEAIVKGDEKIYSVAAASVLAKVTRDEYMKNLSKEIPVYGFEKNKGYGTAHHLNALRLFGKSTHHRELYIRKVFGIKA